MPMIATPIRITCSLLALLVLTLRPALATCNGADLIDALSAPDRARLADAVNAEPYPEGNLWRAERAGSTIHVAGTMHLPDPRHARLLGQLKPIIATADRVFLEATMEDMSEMQSGIASDPALLFLQSGPSLLDLLPPEDWKHLSEELAARGIPGFFAAKMQPWYAGMILNIPPCAMGAVTIDGGLDQLVAEHAQQAGVPTLPLEDPRGLLENVAGGPIEEQLDMLMIALGQAGYAEDGYATMLNSYFGGQHREIWEFYRMLSADQPGRSPAEWAALYDGFEIEMLTNRNRAWVDVLQAEAHTGQTLVAVGAAHLSGNTGVLNLLAEAGYSLTRLDP